MIDFLLVHGSAHGAWCWTDLIPRLTQAGHQARAIDLPSHGADTTPAHDVTLDSYADAIEAALSDQTVVVAHSMAGVPATLAADRSPQRVSQIIYLCTHVPIPGKSIVDMRSLAQTQPLASALIPSADGVTVTVDPDQAVAKFYHDVPPARAAWATSMLCPQPTLPQATPYPDPGGVIHNRHFIICTDDRAIPPTYQAARTADWPVGQVSRLDTSHSPFLSAPETLATLLIAIAQNTPTTRPDR